MNIAIFWLDNKNEPRVEFLQEDELGVALKRTNELRDAGMHHVVLSTNFSQSVGKPGVSDVLPPGYDWKKRRI